MRFVDATTYSSDRPWGADLLVAVGNATVRLHWTDQPYVWHVNDCPEVFVVLSGEVRMHYRIDGQEHQERLVPGRVCVAEAGDEHIAHPVARRGSLWSSAAAASEAAAWRQQQVRGRRDRVSRCARWPRSPRYIS